MDILPVGYVSVAGKPNIYKVTYAYYRPDADCLQIERRYYRTDHKYTPATKGGWTYCFIHRRNQITLMGSARCSPKDNFCYDTGRRIALGRALEALRDGYDCISPYAKYRTNERKRTWIQIVWQRFVQSLGRFNLAGGG